MTACKKCGTTIGTEPGCEHWDADAIENYNERAAIMEFDGGMTRKQAEENAARLVADEINSK